MNSPHDDPLAWIDHELAELRRQDLRRQATEHRGPQQARLMVGGRELINFGSNDYLGLAADPRLIAAAQAALADEGCGAGASPLVTGYGWQLVQLERRLAEFEAVEAALVFSSGYAANLGAIAALVGRGDTIFADQKIHASMIDGCRLSRAAVQVYPHANAQALAEMLAAESTVGQADGRRLIVTESIFSMDGDRAPLVELAELAERFNCMLLVDEAHATGLFGKHGRGLSEELGIEQRVSLRVGTLSKSLGCAGGFVCGRRAAIEWLRNRARPYVFSTALPPAICAAAITALEIVRQQPERAATLARRATELHEELVRQGWQTGASSSQIIPIYLGSAARALCLAEQLAEQGLWVPAIRPPSVPEGESLLRISLGCGHTPAMIARLTAALQLLHDQSAVAHES